MTFGEKLKEARKKAGLSQEEFAEKISVSRSAVAKWETDKSYPDIHSLLMVGNLFGVSLDTLIKGDIEIMKEKVEETKVKSFQRDSNIFAVLLIVSIATVIPLYKWLGIPGLLIWAVLAAATAYYCYRVEKVKQAEDIHTYKEIVAFTNGEKLDGIEKAREEGKRGYQNVMKVLVGAAVGVVVAMIIFQFI